MAQGRVQWRAFVKTVMNINEFKSTGNYLMSQTTTDQESLYAMELEFDCGRCCRKHLVFAECESLVRIHGHFADGSSVVGGSPGPHDRENRQPICK